jgi:hypothetical protein
MHAITIREGKNKIPGLGEITYFTESDTKEVNRLAQVLRLLGFTVATKRLTKKFVAMAQRLKVVGRPPSLTPARRKEEVTK